MMNGVADVFRNPGLVGRVRYWFTVDDRGVVEGRIEDVTYATLPPVAPRVSQNYLPTGPEDRLELKLTDGRRVSFFLASSNGDIASGRLEDALP